ncbi:hypothetical protein Bca101_085759 [Brassica carinata]
MALNSYMPIVFKHKFGSCNWYMRKNRYGPSWLLGVLYIKIRRFSGEIELKYLIGKTLMEPLSNASAEKSLATRCCVSSLP